MSITPRSTALVQRYAPELDQRYRSHLKSTTDSRRVDKTNVKVKGTWMYLYCAVDSAGHTLEFQFSASRDALAAQRFFVKILNASHNRTPRVINIDKNAAYPQAFGELKASEAVSTACELRQNTYLNNLIEQDHRFIKRLIRPGMGFFSFLTAWRTFQVYEVIHIMRKVQVQGATKGDSASQASFNAGLFGLAI